MTAHEDLQRLAEGATSKMLQMDLDALERLLNYKEAGGAPEPIIRMFRMMAAEIRILRRLALLAKSDGVFYALRFAEMMPSHLGMSGMQRSQLLDMQAAIAALPQPPTPGTK